MCGPEAPLFTRLKIRPMNLSAPSTPVKVIKKQKAETPQPKLTVGETLEQFHAHLHDHKTRYNSIITGLVHLLEQDATEKRIQEYLLSRKQPRLRMLYEEFRRRQRAGEFNPKPVDTDGPVLKYEVPYYKDLRNVDLDDPAPKIKARDLLHKLTVEELRANKKMSLQKAYTYHHMVTNEAVCQDKMSVLILKQWKRGRPEEDEKFTEKLEESEGKKQRLFVLKKELERIMNKIDSGKTHVDPKAVVF